MLMEITHRPFLFYPKVKKAIRTVGCGALIAVSLGCSPDEPTQLVAGMTTQMRVPDEIKSVGVVVQSSGRLVFCDSYPVSDGSVTLPSTLATSAENSPNDPVTVTVLGFGRDQSSFSADCVVRQPDVGEDGVTVMRRRRSTYLENRALYLPMPIKHACVDVSCPQGETCVGGLCQKMDVDPSKLVDFDDRLVFGKTNTCFDVGGYLPPTKSIPAQLVDADTCEFRIDIPQGASVPAHGSLNVRIVHENFTSEVLDLDEAEGFVLVDDPTGTRFRLAPSLCTSRYKTGKILGVWATKFCASKTPLQPICEDDLQEIVSGESSLYGPAACVSGSRLVPTESALYVLMDRSDSMRAYFGPDGLHQLLSLSLEDPVFERTRVAFSLLPGQASDCGEATNRFAAPTGPEGVPFMFAKDAREAVAPIIANEGNVWNSDSPVMFDAALSAHGAYAALKNLTPTAPTKDFNRRAVLVLGNRDFLSHCAGGSDLLDLVSAARAEGLYTYFVVLKAPPATDQQGRDPLADAAQLALAGGTEVFDATQDPNAGALALQTITADLGSCLYDAPEGVAVVNDIAHRTVTYLNPLTNVRETIPYNEHCTEQVSGDSGWNTDALGRIRICGYACETLRDTAKMLSVSAAQSGQPVAVLPIHLTEPCK
ncbi:MAG TPA: hypothetical protein PLM08_13040 [Polyangiaceae bacterium]|nr:hypothetical protein [Polyangiaceae bacterium]